MEDKTTYKTYISRTYYASKQTNTNTHNNAIENTDGAGQRLDNFYVRIFSVFSLFFNFFFYNIFEQQNKLNNYKFF